MVQDYNTGQNSPVSSKREATKVLWYCRMWFYQQLGAGDLKCSALSGGEIKQGVAWCGAGPLWLPGLLTPAFG